jgi:hypothetical protein
MDERRGIAAILAAGLLQGRTPIGTTTLGQLAVRTYKDILAELEKEQLPPPPPPAPRSFLDTTPAK